MAMVHTSSSEYSRLEELPCSNICNLRTLLTWFAFLRLSWMGMHLGGQKLKMNNHWALHLNQLTVRLTQRQASWSYSALRGALVLPSGAAPGIIAAVFV